MVRAPTFALYLFALSPIVTGPVFAESSLYQAPMGMPAVSELVLIDSDADLVLTPLVDGAVINLAGLDTGSLNVRALVDDPFTTGSVVFDLNEVDDFRTESTAPYALAGDDASDYAPLELTPGAYTITATPYTGAGGTGLIGTPLTIGLTIIDDPDLLAPVVDAGADRYVFTPDDTVDLEASFVDPDGDPVLIREWSQVDGPPAQILATVSASTTITGLVAGDYRFRFAVEDVEGSRSFDDVAVIVRDPDVSPGTLSGETKTWHAVTLDFAGDPTSESATPNPFRNLRLQVAFRHESGATRVVAGYYAADGDAAETSATSGNVWRAHFVPDLTGTWQYVAEFRSGPDVAISLDPFEGQPVQFSGSSGSFVVTPTDATPPDLRAKGKLEFVGEHYLRHAGNGEYFLKAGANSPENFLGYHEFDDTVDQGGLAVDLTDGLHRYEPHIGDWSPGDPTWQGGKGKGIIGAINYLASRGMNSVYFLTMNVEGDGQEVYPWTSPDERFRFDCSKLDQWHLVFEHMESKGMMLHVQTQEHENDQLLEGVGTMRRLYLRELVARFGHHNAVQWNLGEENTNTPAIRRGMSTYLRALDSYAHPIVVHNHPLDQESLFDPLLGSPILDGPSVQTDATNAGDDVLNWRVESAAAGREWVVCVDEIFPSEDGVVPDSEDPEHDVVRRDVLWASLMSGGAGCEWYFGYDHPHDDLDCEDWRSRDAMWDLTDLALEFFREYTPFWEMDPRNEIVGSQARCFAKKWDTYVVHLPHGGSTTIDLEGAVGPFRVRWFDPRNGGSLQLGTTTIIGGSGDLSLGWPPSRQNDDWVVLITRDPSVAVGDPAEILAPVRLLAPSPNPARTAARLAIDLDERRDLRLSVYDAAGRLVRVLLDGPLPAGRRQLSWDGVDASGAPVASGVYWLELQSTGIAAREKLLWVR